MKYFISETNFISFSDMEPLCQQFISCQGTTLATAAPSVIPGSVFAKILILAQYMSASAESFVFPTLPPGLPPTEVDVFAAGPNGSAITMFLPPGCAFNDGSTSISIPCGTGKKFASLGTNSATFSTIIGIMG